MVCDSNQWIVSSPNGRSGGGAVEGEMRRGKEGLGTQVPFAGVKIRMRAQVLIWEKEVELEVNIIIKSHKSIIMVLWPG